MRGLSVGRRSGVSLDSVYRNGIYEALRQSSPSVENGQPIVLDGQHLLDMTAAVVDYLDGLFEFDPPFSGETLPPPFPLGGRR